MEELRNERIRNNLSREERLREREREREEDNCKEINL